MPLAWISCSPTKVGPCCLRRLDATNALRAAILYARSPGNFISKFLQGSQGKTHALSLSAASPMSNGNRWSNRGLESPASFLSSSSGRQTVPAHAIPLNVADRAVLASILEYLYTAKGAPEALMTFLFEEQLPAAQEVSAEDRLRSDMLFMWCGPVGRCRYAG
jgi:hypothetical protein